MKEKGKKKKQGHKIFRLLLIVGVAVLAAVLLYFFVGKDLIDLHELKKLNPETEEFASAYFPERFKSHDIDLTGEITKGEIPHFLQWDKRWGYRHYGGSMIAVSGCGPTCLSMVLCGLTGDDKWNPYEVAKWSKENGYYSIGTGTSWLLMQEGAEKLGLSFKEVPADEGVMRKRLSEGKPIICSVKKGDFTTTGHFIVLAGLNEDGTVKVNDPNSIIRSEKGWELSKIIPQCRAIWAYSCEGGN